MQGSSKNSLQLEHHFPHPPSRIWRAWTNPSMVKMWFGSDPDGTVLEAELDVRVNGAFRVTFANSDGTEYTAGGIYKEVEPYKKLFFTWGWEDRPEVMESISLELKPEGDGTLMSFEHLDIDRHTAHNYAEGWKSTFNKLERALNGLATISTADTAYSFRSATGSDAAKVTALVQAAYGHYPEQIGMVPRPMVEDYAEVIRNNQVTVAESNAALAGVIVLARTDEGFLIDNVAVDPAHRGKGLGRALLELAEAEAQRAGFNSVYLYTHENMKENLALYSRIGYVEYDRRSLGDFSLVYMRKQLG